MANQSSANVTITAHGCVREFIKYVETASNTGYYTLIDEQSIDDPNIETDSTGRESATFNGWAEGRWAYSNNLQGYFAPLHAKESWRDTPESQKAYGALVGKLRRDKQAYLKVEYEDVETGAGFIDIGSMELNHETVMDEPFIDSDSHDSTVFNMVHYLGRSEYDAIDAIWGDEVADAWEDYSQGNGSLDVDSFIDEHASDIYDGKDVTEILRKEAAEPYFEEYEKSGGQYDLEQFCEEYGSYCIDGEFDLESWLEKEKVDRETE